jgi:hypothetical protein
MRPFEYADMRTDCCETLDGEPVTAMHVDRLYIGRFGSNAAAGLPCGLERLSWAAR